MEKTLSELAAIVKGTIVGDGNTKIIGVTGLEHPLKDCLTYLTDAKRLEEAEKTPIAALIVPPQVQSSRKPLIQSQHPKLAWSVLLGVFNPPCPYSKTIPNQAFISKRAKIG